MGVASVEQNDIEHAAGMNNVDRAAKYLQDIGYYDWRCGLPLPQ